MNTYKCSTWLPILFVWLLLAACQESTGQQSKMVAASCQTPKAILHKWRLDMPTMKRQMIGFRDAVVKVASELRPGSETKVRQTLDPRIAGWIEEMKNDSQEFQADGTRLFTTSGKTGKGTYRVSARQDSLHFLTADGQKVEDYGVISLSDTVMIVTQRIEIPMINSKEKRFYQATVKFVR